MSEGGTGVATEALVWVSLLVGAGCLISWAWDSWRVRRVRHRTETLLGTSEGDADEQQQHRSRESRSSKVPCKEHRKWWTQRAVRKRLRAGAAALGACAFAVTVIGGVPGWLAGSVGAYCVWRWMGDRDERTESREEAAGARAAAEQLPLTAELLAACLAAGSGPAQAADAVGRSIGGPLGIRLIRASTELQLGAEPAAVWGRFGSLPGSEGFVRSMERAGTAGVPAAEPVTRLASELRAAQARAASARARRAAVLVTGPLGLCFLPAFLAVGVAPVVMGLARSLL